MPLSRILSAGAVGMGLLASGAAWSAQPEFSGQVRLLWANQEVSTSGPLAQANALQGGVAPLPVSAATLETELRASAHGVHGVATLQQQRPESAATDSRAWVNELYAAHDGGAWQYSAGKKIVSWDVGYGFRPNDVVQQEERRTLVTSTPEGRALMMAEHYSASAAWSVVWVNATKPAEQLGSQEPALAARYYLRDGAIDWHGFARVGAHTGASVGGAAAWVASESLELHSSLRYLERVDSRAMNPAPTGLVVSNPWRNSVRQDVKQWLVGGTWTTQSQISLLMEAWWDGTAPADADWDAWAARNAQLATLATRGAPAPAVAGNLAWQAQAFGVSQNLRRSNVFARLSWQHGAWQPALDVLYTPADQGHAVTAGVTWQGDRVQVQGGWRVYGGPENAVMAQLPSRSTAYVGVTWAF